MESKSGIGVTIIRWIVGATFLFSGLTKCIDPVGISIYVDKYLATYGLEALMSISEPIAVLLSTLELLLGVLLITGVFRCLVSTFSLIIVAIFTVVTLLSATILPVGECGCFGDIVPLTPWQTFFKNVVLLILSFIVWRGSRTQQRVGVRDVVILVVAIAIPLAINLYALRHLPIVDTMPYKVGTTLYHDVLKEREMEEASVQNVLIFRNITTGETVEFDAMDSTCWEDENLEFVDAKTIESLVETTYGEFRLYNVDGEDCSIDILGRRGRVALLCVNDIHAMTDKHRKGLSTLLASYPSHGIVILTSVNREDVASQLDVRGVELYTIDAMTLRSVIRSDIGVVVLRDGVVEYKSDIQDI